MKKFKKILTTLVLVPTLFLPNFAFAQEDTSPAFTAVSYTHLRAHETTE